MTDWAAPTGAAPARRPRRRHRGRLGALGRRPRRLAGRAGRRRLPRAADPDRRRARADRRPAGVRRRGDVVDRAGRDGARRRRDRDARRGYHRRSTAGAATTTTTGGRSSLQSDQYEGWEWAVVARAGRALGAARRHRRPRRRFRGVLGRFGADGAWCRPSVELERLDRDRRLPLPGGRRRRACGGDAVRFTVTRPYVARLPRTRSPRASRHRGARLDWPVDTSPGGRVRRRSAVGVALAAAAAAFAAALAGTGERRAVGTPAASAVAVELYDALTPYGQRVLIGTVPAIADRLELDQRRGHHDVGPTDQGTLDGLRRHIQLPLPGIGPWQATALWASTAWGTAGGRASRATTPCAGGGPALGRAAAIRVRPGVRRVRDGVQIAGREALEAERVEQRASARPRAPSRPRGRRRSSCSRGSSRGSRSSSAAGSRRPGSCRR